MRTTLDIDDDVLQAAKDLARRQQITAGQIISRLLRERLTAELASQIHAAGGMEGILETAAMPFPRLTSSALVRGLPQR